MFQFYCGSCQLAANVPCTLSSLIARGGRGIPGPSFRADNFTCLLLDGHIASHCILDSCGIIMDLLVSTYEVLLVKITALSAVHCFLSHFTVYLRSKTYKALTASILDVNSTLPSNTSSSSGTWLGTYFELVNALYFLSKCLECHLTVV